MSIVVAIIEFVCVSPTSQIASTAKLPGLTLHHSRVHGWYKLILTITLHCSKLLKKLLTLWDALYQLKTSKQHPLHMISRHAYVVGYLVVFKLVPSSDVTRMRLVNEP